MIGPHGSTESMSRVLRNDHQRAKSQAEIEAVYKILNEDGLHEEDVRCSSDEVITSNYDGEPTLLLERVWEPPVPFAHMDVPSFPTEVLPDWLRDFVEAEATATQTPPDLAGMLTLAVCAAAIAKKATICVREGWIEPLNLFVLITQPSGTRKTRVFADVVEPLEAYDAAEAERRRRTIEEAQSRYRITENARRRSEEAAANAKTDEERERLTQEALRLGRELTTVTIPALPRLLADDISPERLATLLCDQGGRMAVMSAEGDVFDLMAGRYSNTGVPNFGVYLKGHAGDTLRVDRVGRPPEYIREPALTLALAVQPDVLRGLIDKPSFRGRGLLGRFLYSCPRDLLGYRKIDPPAVPMGVQREYERKVTALLSLPFGTDSNGRRAPHMLRLSREACDRLRVFETWVEPQLASLGELGMMTDWAGKLVGAAARIAGVLHVANHEKSPWEVTVSAETMDRAIRLGEYLVPHAKSAYATMGADPKVEHARFILDWLEKTGMSTVKKRDIYQGTKGRFKRMKDLEPVLALLVDHGYLHQQQAPNREGPGRKPSPMFDVNPLSDFQNSHNSHNQTRFWGSGNLGNSGQAF